MTVYADTINIISSAPGAPTSGGTKVFQNLVKGLTRIGQSFVVNRHPRSTRRIWLHNQVLALPEILRATDAERVLGPNLFVMPRDIPGLRFDGCIYVQPCDWAAQMWKGSGFTGCPIKVWPVGIDTDEFRPEPALSRRDDHVLVYHKLRDKRELDQIKRVLDERKLSYELITYGHYRESDYKAALSNAAFVIWHGRQESQGLALLEALASGVPIIVCDVRTVFDSRGDSYVFHPDAARFPVTSAPYFDDTCGVKISDLSELPRAIELMRLEADAFHPREFVMREMSLEGQAKAFVELWGAWPGASADGGRVMSSAPEWEPKVLDTVTFRLRRRLHGLVRTLQHE